jgi:hypothetical protein
MLGQLESISYIKDEKIKTPKLDENKYLVYKSR